MVEAVTFGEPNARAARCPRGRGTFESDEVIDNSGLRQAFITFYMDKMEALWKERSSSLEMVQTIQRSLLNSPDKVEADTPVEAEKEENADMKTEDTEEKPRS
ncbi:hypothetical protein BBJ28_00023631 [Nothophytophthora sp. Chile5]|nr:hypothetical protein BBJ28_00023631 [Nothophytophthora sp. Chile5]